MNFRWKHIIIFSFVSTLFLAFACQNQSKGFALPQGSIENGKQSFIALNCTQCHSVGDIQWTGVEIEGDVHVRLRGETTEIKSYRELVTSIINPSHKISRKHILEMTTKSMESKMRIYNEMMTVQDLVDIVTFLQEEFNVKVPSGQYYEK